MRDWRCRVSSGWGVRCGGEMCQSSLVQGEQPLKSKSRSGVCLFQAFLWLGTALWRRVRFAQQSFCFCEHRLSGPLSWLGLCSVFPPAGVCLGMQLAVVEFARSVLGWQGNCTEPFLGFGRFILVGGVIPVIPVTLYFSLVGRLNFFSRLIKKIPLLLC